jgi:hypothetical protein
MPISAEEINNAISGSSVSLGEADGAPLGNVLHSTSKPLKANGKKYNKEGNTAVGNNMTIPVGPVVDCYGAPGLLFSYVYSYAVSTAANGDLLALALDPQPDPNDLTKVSKLCAFPTHFEATVYQKITGGTGEFEGACGWVETNVQGVFLGPESTLAAYEGTQVGEIFVGTDCL